MARPDDPRPGTPEHARLVREIVERHQGEPSGFPHLSVCQICGRWARIDHVIQGMVRSMNPARMQCGRHGDRHATIRAAREHPERYCRICATTLAPAAASGRLCPACLPSWRSPLAVTSPPLESLRGTALRRGRPELAPLSRLVEHPEPVTE